jgi:outer membrane protein assembly factor BamE (lipoprotein component of BamABCDE complex)
MQGFDLLRSRLALLVLLSAMVLNGCSAFVPKSQVRGNKVDPDALKELVVGTSTRNDVQTLLGSPTTKSSFDDNIWIYIGGITRPRIASTEAVLNQEVVALTFDQGGVLRNVQTLSQKDSLPVDVVSRSTPSPGSNASFMQQLLGNVGRFSATPVGSGGSGPSGGAPSQSP